MSRFVAVVGTVNHDEIVDATGRRHESLGGILYNVVVLATLLEGSGITVRAVGRLGEEHRREAERLLEGFPAADASGLIADPAGTNRSRLDYSRPGDRVEHVELRVATLSLADLQGVEGADAVLVNMISGRDVTAATLADLRRRSRGRFLLDVQALARTQSAPRRPRRVPDWRAWCAPFDVVRGNEEEITWFADRPGEMPRAVSRILEAGPREVLVTAGEAGAWLGRARKPGEVRHVPTFPAGGDVVDPTGCGDSFLSGVCAGSMLGLEPEAAATLGAWIAARVAGLPGLEALQELRGARERAAREVEALRPLWPAR